MTRRPAYMLVEVVGTLALLSACGTVLAVSLGSILSAQRGVGELTSRFAILDDYTNSLRRDLLRAKGVELQTTEEDEGILILRLARGSAELEYRFEQNSLRRRVQRGSWGSDKTWALPHSQVAPHVTRVAESPAGLVHLTIEWQRNDKKDPQPARRFDVGLPFGHLSDESE